MQETCETVTIPKIVVCSKSVLSDNMCLEMDECEKRSSRARRIVRSRHRRNSRRLSISLVDRGSSSSSSRSPSPSTTLKSRQSDEEAKDCECNGKKDEMRVQGRGVEGQENERQCLDECSTGYKQYLRLLKVPQTLEWGEGSGDDLSSEWDSDHTDGKLLTTLEDVGLSVKVILEREWKTVLLGCKIRSDD